MCTLQRQLEEEKRHTGYFDASIQFSYFPTASYLFRSEMIATNSNKPVDT
jgi:hypothetical protein